MLRERKQKIILLSFTLLQAFWMVWYFLRGLLFYVLFFASPHLTALDWKQLWWFSYEFICFAIPIFIILILAKRLVKNLFSHQLFSKENLKKNRQITIFMTFLPLCDAIQNVIFYQKSYQNIELFVENYILPYMGNAVISLILLALVFVIKDGLKLQEEVDSFI